MKQLLLILVATALISCGSKSAQEGEIITAVEYYSETRSIYEVDGKHQVFKEEDGPKFYARKGLYNVGDTLRYAK